MESPQPPPAIELGPAGGEILYEVLSPLGGSPSGAAASGPYLVFRNEVSLPSAGSSFITETSAPEYFSLDADDENNVAVTLAPSPSVSTAATPAREPERTLEGNWFRANCRFRSPMLQLHQEIIDFCEFLSPTPEEKASRDEAVNAVVDVIKFIWPKSKAEVFGSFKTGLFLPSSDIDVVILESNLSSPQLGLYALGRALTQRRIAKHVQIIAKAHVPIIKFVEKRSDVSFDISFDVDNGPKAAEFIKVAVSQYPPLRPLCLILKIFLQQRELNEVYTGGIGSYALLTMLIAMLQNYHHRQASPEHNLGVLLSLLVNQEVQFSISTVRDLVLAITIRNLSPITPDSVDIKTVHFFDMYGRKLNTANVGISCSEEGTFFAKSKKSFSSSTKGKASIISIQDPQAPDNDIGKNSFNYFLVRSAFAMALRNLTDEKAILSLGPDRSILGTIIRPDAVLLERKGGSAGEVTFEKLLPGAGVPLPEQNGDHRDIYCNWQLDDEDEESLPRNDTINGHDKAHSSGKKRKKSIQKRYSKKVKSNEDGGTSRCEKKSSRKDKYLKKQDWRHHQDGGGGGRNGQWSHSRRGICRIFTLQLKKKQ